jgi:hypothetical protein
MERMAYVDLCPARHIALILDSYVSLEAVIHVPAGKKREFGEVRCDPLTCSSD